MAPLIYYEVLAGGTYVLTMTLLVALLIIVSLGHPSRINTLGGNSDDTMRAHKLH